VDTVGVFTDENESRLDAVFREQGLTNPNVIRGPVDEDNPLGEILLITRAFDNLNERVTEGYDVSVNYVFDTSVGSFDTKLNAARILTFDQEPGGKAAILVAAGADESVLGASVGSLIEREFIPKWRATAAVNWNSNGDVWGAGVFANYVGKVFEPTVTDSDGNQMEVGDLTIFNAFAVHRGLLGEGSTIRLGINNLFDKDPPLARESFGFEGELHSSRGRYFFVGVTKRFY